MVVQLVQPCRVRYRTREAATLAVPAARSVTQQQAICQARVKVDFDLCQGHGVCVSEAPGVFALDKKELKVRVLIHDATVDNRGRIEQAIKHCPTGALSIEDLSASTLKES
jgi:ferredoxin